MLNPKFPVQRERTLGRIELSLLKAQKAHSHSTEKEEMKEGRQSDHGLLSDTFGFLSSGQEIISDGFLSRRGVL